MSDSQPSSGLPQALVVSPRGRWAWIWLVPLAAAAVTALLLVQAWQDRGVGISVRFADGQGLRPGDPVRHLGVEIGRIETIELIDGVRAVAVIARLHPAARDLARAGTRFWIVRPRLSLGAVEGLDTVVGPRYLAALPGDGPLVEAHDGLDEEPVMVGLTPGGVEFTVVAPALGGLRRGSPVTFRQMAVGRVLDARLAGDGNGVEVRCYVEPAYAGLLRSTSVFWNASGIDLAAGLMKGVRIEVDSLQSVLAGGIAFATPDAIGLGVGNGTRFTLLDAAPEHWRTWRPTLAVGGALVAPGRELPWPTAVRLSWQGSSWWNRLHVVEGWGLPIPGGLLVPRGLAQPPSAANARWTIGEDNLPCEVVVPVDGLARIPWTDAIRTPRTPIRERIPGEDLLLLGDRAQGARPIAGSVVENDGVVRLEPLAGTWQGAVVISRSDGAVVGVLAAEDVPWRVLPIPAVAIPTP